MIIVLPWIDQDLGGGTPDVYVGTGDKNLIGTADKVVQWNEETFEDDAGQGNQNANTEGGVIGNEFWEYLEDNINWGDDDFDHDDVKILSIVIAISWSGKDQLGSQLANDNNRGLWYR